MFLQCLGWLMQLLAVYVAMQAFGIDAPLPAAGLVLVLMNIATIVPLWPGNVGLVQAAVALPLRNYGVPYATGFAYGLALQAIEMACGIGLGLDRDRARGDLVRDAPPHGGRRGVVARTRSKRCTRWSRTSRTARTTRGGP